MSGSLVDALSGVSRVHLDTVSLIYFMQRHVRFGPVVKPVFQLIEDGKLECVSSMITLTEVLVHPLQANDQSLAHKYGEILTKRISLKPVDRATAEEAARIRAQYRVRTPDAIQLATSILEGCEAFLTNDKQLRQVAEANVLLVGDFVNS